MKRSLWVACCVLVALPGAARSAPAPGEVPAIFEVGLTRIADGIYAAIRPESGTRPPVEGNVIMILDDEDVVVVDAAGVPGRSSRVIAALKELTDKPVRYLINTHGHADHTLGNADWIDTWPGLDIVAHPTVVTYLENGGSDFVYERRDHPESSKEVYRERMENSGKDNPPVAAYLRRYYEGDLYEQSRSLHDLDRIQLPTLTVEDGMRILRGDRVIDVRHIGEGNTPSDLIVHLPKERILIAGDIVTRPIPYGFTHAGAWLETLRRLQDIDFDVLIPGHGPVLRGAEADEYVRHLVSFAEAVIEGVDAAVADGLSEEETIERVDVSESARWFSHDDPVIAYLFDIWARRPLVSRAYQARVPKEETGP